MGPWAFDCVHFLMTISYSRLVFRISLCYMTPYPYQENYATLIRNLIYITTRLGGQLFILLTNLLHYKLNTRYQKK